MLDIIIQKAKSVLTDPRGFFQKLKKESGLRDAFMYFALLSVVSLIGGIIVNLLWPAPMVSLENVAPLSAAAIVMSSVAGYFLSLLLSFVWAGLLHVWIMIWGGRAPYAKTYQLTAYAGTPSMLLGWIPFVGILAGIYGLVLFIIGAQRTHGLSKTRSIWCFLIPAIVLVLLVVALFSLGLFYLFGPEMV